MIESNKHRLSLVLVVFEGRILLTISSCLSNRVRKQKSNNDEFR